MDDFLTLMDVTSEELRALLDTSRAVKAAPAEFSSRLDKKTLVTIFQKTSTRTRVSFEVGMAQLGGHAIYLDFLTSNLKVGALADEIRCLARYADVIMARVYGQEILEEMRAAAGVPVINGLSDAYHPCQAVADLLTIEEHCGSLPEVKVAYVGDGNNVCNSLLIGVALLGGRISVATPPAYRPPAAVVEFAQQRLGNRCQIVGDPTMAVHAADAIYTDTWVSLGQEEETDARVAAFQRYQVNVELVAHAAPNYKFLHCLPAHRGYEVTDAIVDSDHSVVFDQAENRLHAQKAILLHLMSATEA